MRFNREMLRLYAVTDRSWLRGRTLLEQVEDALRGGVTMVQLREKELDETSFMQEAIQMVELCHSYGVPLLINDNIDVALHSGADGVHVGQSDTDARIARQLLGPEKIIGVTAKTVEQARLAQEAGADYIGSGAVFGTATKMDARPMSAETLRTICTNVEIPVVAIGGIHRSNLPELTGTGITGAAVVSGIFAAEDIEEECKVLRSIVEKVILTN